ncbi:kinase-like protein, partial [Peniophora sp. CONT]
PLLGVTLPRDQLYLESYLGSGGFSVVFRGIQARTGKGYAVKTIPFAPAGTPLNAQQKAEACLHSRASGHPNVVKIHKYFLHHHGGVEYLILVMDLILGPNLHELINSGFLVNKPQYLRHLFGQMLGAVVYCHEKGIYHRDLKPQNFLCSADLTTIYLADFGLATVEPFYRHVELGSTAYMSPEVTHCTDPTTLIHAPSTDVWSLGVILITLSTGCAPWKSAAMDDIDFQVFATGPVARLSRHPMPLPVEMLVRRALQCNPRERISLGELRAAFLLLDN